MRRFLTKFLIIGIAIVAGLFLWDFGQSFYRYLGPSESLLSQTGFDRTLLSEKKMASTFRFTPNNPFWSDGAEKIRYLYLPPGEKIDNVNPDRWNFPVGSRIWKSFERDGVSVETRMLYKTGSNPWDWDMAVYAWQEDYSDAEKLVFGETNVKTTAHDIPSPKDCEACHSAGENTRPLGLTAIQLPWTDENNLSITKLIELNLLTNPPKSRYEIPGDDLTKAVLGYFDTNCGSCHYQGATYVEEDIPLRLNLTIDSLASVSLTNVYKTAINAKPLLSGLGTEVYIHPGSPQDSFIYRRLSLRDGILGWQMPPLATEVVDHKAVELISEWINSLSTVVTN